MQRHKKVDLVIRGGARSHLVGNGQKVALNPLTNDKL